MKNIKWNFLILAVLIVTMFIAVGLAIALRNVWLIVLFIVLGFFLMGYGIAIKRKQK